MILFSTCSNEITAKQQRTHGDPNVLFASSARMTQINAIYNVTSLGPNDLMRPAVLSDLALWEQERKQCPTGLRLERV